MPELVFPEHTHEKLEELNYYYKVWFRIVRRQRTYVIDTHAGTGYNIINGVKEKGSSLLTIDLLKEDTLNNLRVFLINIDEKECGTLERNIINFISKNNLKVKVGSQILIFPKDWSKIIPEILDKTNDGIRLFLLDSTAIKTLPYDKIIPILKLGISDYDYKESGNEIFINWAWHAIRRQIGFYYKGEEFDYKSLDKFFGPIEWREIADKFNKKLMDELMDELVITYAQSLKIYFKYVMIHPIYERIKDKKSDGKKRGKVKYFLIFLSNYREAPKIIGKKFKEFSEKKYYPPGKQTNLLSFTKAKNFKNISEKKLRITINHKIKNLETKLNKKFNNKQKAIIKFLYKQKTQDFGCYDFRIKETFKLNENDADLNFLIEKNIITSRKKIDKKGIVWNFYYLIHSLLVERREFIYYKGKFMEFENGILKTIKLK